MRTAHILSIAIAAIFSMLYAISFVNAASVSNTSYLAARLNYNTFHIPNNSAPRFYGHTQAIRPVLAPLVSSILGIYQVTANSNERQVSGLTFAMSGVEDSQLILRIKMQARYRASAAPRHARSEELFGSAAIPFGKLPAMARMAPIEKDMSGGFFKHCSTGRCEQSRKVLLGLIDAEKGKGFVHLVGAVNNTVNRLVRYQPDRITYRKLDFWANPSTTLNKGAGDCEDYALLKMAVLSKAGMPRSSMSIVILRDTRRNVYHAVLSIRTSQGNYILDNARTDVVQDIDLPDYLPLFSVSENSGRIYGKRTGGANLMASLGGLAGIAPGEGGSDTQAVVSNSGSEELTAAMPR